MNAAEREQLRRAVDRAARARIGASRESDSWVSIPEASSIVGIRIGVLRPKLKQLGIQTRRSGPRSLIQVSSLDRLRE